MKRPVQDLSPAQLRMADARGPRHDWRMAVPPSEDALAEIRALLDDRVEVEGSQDMTQYERVLDVAKAHEFWSDLAIRRLPRDPPSERSGMRHPCAAELNLAGDLGLGPVPVRGHFDSLATSQPELLAAGRAPH